jgi:hypothetical protein
MDFGQSVERDCLLGHFNTPLIKLEVKDSTFYTFVIVTELSVFKKTELSFLLHSIFI